MKFYYPILVLILGMTFSTIYTMEYFRELRKPGITREEYAQAEQKLKRSLQPMAFRHIEAGNIPSVKFFIKSELLNEPLYDEKTGNTQLHTAVISGDPEMLDLIIGVNPELLNIKNKAGQTPLELAFEINAKEKVIDELLKGHEILGAQAP